MTCYNFLLWQACETISLLTQLWPEGSDIRRVLCVTSCSLSLEMYHSFLENEEEKASKQTCEVKQVWLLHWDVPWLFCFIIFTYYFPLVAQMFSLVYVHLGSRKSPYNSCYKEVCVSWFSVFLTGVSHKNT